MRIRCIIGVIIIMFCLCACIKSDDKLEKEKKDMEMIANSIMLNIESYNTQNLEALLTKSVLESDYEKGLEYIYQIYRGPHKEISDTGTHIQDYFERGKQIKVALSYFNIKTEEKTYVLFFRYILQDDTNNENVGVSVLKISDTEEIEEANRYNYGENYDRIGIYNPEWDEER